MNTPPLPRGPGDPPQTLSPAASDDPIAAASAPDPTRRRDSESAPGQEDPLPSIVSVNDRSPTQGRGPARAVILVLGGALLLGLLVWFAQNWATRLKDSLKTSAQTTKASVATGPVRNMLNPEGGAPRDAKRLKLGADATPLPPAAAAPGGDGLRPLRGPDGQVMVTRDGKALGVDAQGQVIEVPPILPLDDERNDRVPLADERGAKAGSPGSSRRPPSRYGGALMADGGAGKAASVPSASPSAAPSTNSQATTELLKSLIATKQGAADPGSRAATATPSKEPAAALPDNAEPPAARATGPVASHLGSSSTPTARARRMADLTLLLPKGRQVDCVLTTRIVNELAGLTSCALTQNIYSANGQVLLLERGSELTGEYGVATQLGLRRLFIVWTRVRTPHGIEVDLQSPGADPLGTSGVPGHLEQRWFERIGAALLLSVMRDVVEIEMARQQAGRGGDNTIVLGPQPGQNTVNAGQDIGEQVVKQTINVKPTLYINEGSRISIYVARDLDFSAVYALRTLATASERISP